MQADTRELQENAVQRLLDIAALPRLCQMADADPTRMTNQRQSAMRLLLVTLLMLAATLSHFLP
jgi:hypothetical protein